MRYRRLKQGNSSIFLKAPPTKNKYEASKQRLSKTFEIGPRSAGAKLLHLGGLGDRKPSELMDEMLELSPTVAFEPHIIFEQVFLEQLPEDFQLQLVNEDFSDTRALASKADELRESRTSMRKNFSINKVRQDQTKYTKKNVQQES